MPACWRSCALERPLGILAELAQRLPDPRSALFVQHSTERLLTQQVHQILAGCPDGNDADELRHDALFQILAEVTPTGEQPLASGSTLARFPYAYTRRGQRQGEAEILLVRRFCANAWRLLVHVVAYALVVLFREANARVPEVARAEVSTLRQRLWKVPAVLASGRGDGCCGCTPPGRIGRCLAGCWGRSAPSWGGWREGAGRPWGGGGPAPVSGRAGRRGRPTPPDASDRQGRWGPGCALREPFRPLRTAKRAATAVAARHAGRPPSLNEHQRSVKRLGAQSGLAAVLKGMTAAKFRKVVAFLRSPRGQRVRTNNHGERLNRQRCADEKVRYRWRTGRGIVRWVVLLRERCWQARQAAAGPQLFRPGSGAEPSPRPAVGATEPEGTERGQATRQAAG